MPHGFNKKNLENKIRAMAKKLNKADEQQGDDTWYSKFMILESLYKSSLSDHHLREDFNAKFLGHSQQKKIEAAFAIRVAAVEAAIQHGNFDGDSEANAVGQKAACEKLSEMFPTGHDQGAASCDAADDDHPAQQADQTAGDDALPPDAEVTTHHSFPGPFFDPHFSCSLQMLIMVSKCNMYADICFSFCFATLAPRVPPRDEAMLKIVKC